MREFISLGGGAKGGFPSQVGFHLHPLQLKKLKLNLLWTVKPKMWSMNCTAKKDSLPYIGETSKTAETRFVGHLNTILQECHSNTNTPVGQHFRSAGHSHTDIQVTPFEKIRSRNHFVRKAREAYLIDKYQLLTNALNKKLWFCLFCFLCISVNWASFEFIFC